MTLYDRNGNPTPVLANSEEFRTNWDRIFGKKDKCPHCGKGSLKPIKLAKFNGDLLNQHLQCDVCDSTYPE